MERLIKKYREKWDYLYNIRKNLNKDIDAEYWLNLGQANVLGDVIVDLIKEHNKKNVLSEYLQKQLSIFETSYNLNNKHDSPNKNT